MADLMKATEAYSALARKYQNFMVPAAKIKVQGKDVISTMHLCVEQMSVLQSLDKAGSCTFSLAGAYDLKKRQFDETVRAKLKLGTVIEVELGYGSSTTMIFKGYISETTVRFGPFPTLDFTAMDVRKLMMDGKERMKNYTVKTYSDAFTDVMSHYQKICTSLAVDKTTVALDGEVITQTKSDYDFVRDQLAFKGDREFFVLAGKAYFRTPRKERTPVTTLVWGEGLLSFERSASYLMAEIHVIGHNEEKNEVCLGKATVKARDGQTAVLAKPQPTVISDPDATDSSRARKRAEFIAEQMSRQGEQAKGVCVGLPELVPGRYLKLSKLGSGLDGSYYITKVTHELGPDGFQTGFETEGWE